MYSHLNGHEWLLVHEKHIWEEIESTIRVVDANKYRTKISKEKTRPGKPVYAPIEINKAFAKRLKDAGWEESRTSYWVTDDYALIRKTMMLPQAEQKRAIEVAGKRPIYSYNQTDFVKKRVAVEVQFGKYSFIAYDLFVKHLAFYVGDKIDVVIELLAMKSLQSEMSSGRGYYE